MSRSARRRFAWQHCSFFLSSCRPKFTRVQCVRLIRDIAKVANLPVERLPDQPASPGVIEVRTIFGQSIIAVVGCRRSGAAEVHLCAYRRYSGHGVADLLNRRLKPKAMTWRAEVCLK